MSDAIVKIQNCNNIKNGEITVYENKINIFFGHNGTGKSTIARAINLTSQGKELIELVPYGLSKEKPSLQIKGTLLDGVAVFDDNYLSQYVYRSDTLIENAFEVFIRSEKYDKAKKNIDDTMSKLKRTIIERKEITDLKDHIGKLLGKIKLKSDSTIAMRGGTKSVLEGKGAYFNPPDELNELKPFFEDDTVSTWADWRLKGFEKFGKKGCCPYCAAGDTEKTEIINQGFVDNFNKVSVETAITIWNALDALGPFLSYEKTTELLSLFGVKGDLEKLKRLLTKLSNEADYLFKQLDRILSFNGTSVDKGNIASLESELEDMKINLQECDTYFVSERTKIEMGTINNEIDELLKEIGVLKGEIGKYNSYIQENIKKKKEDINSFLRTAGFQYTFDIEVNSENNARALLKFILPDGDFCDIKSPENHLSWGEKHAFALILFMFDAISRNAKLIILDDPISSFDSNKKYAIINRLFKTGDKENSLFQRTVLMLTHDFEPVIDYIQVNRDQSSICATYLENINGQLKVTPIKKQDLMSSVVLLKELAMDSSIDISARIGFLRKFIEHQYKNPWEFDAYHILSSVIHRRSKPTSDKDGQVELTTKQINEGLLFIRGYISDFEYESALIQCNPLDLLERYSTEESDYIKMLILRAYTEQDRDARERLCKMNDVLRKYVDETYHIENDYLYSLDVRRFNIVPYHYIYEADKFIDMEKKELLDVIEI